MYQEQWTINKKKIWKLMRIANDIFLPSRYT